MSTTLPFALIGSLSGVMLGWLMGFLSLFLILLILIQRGKGGGLSGALGGPGGQSAFGSKAGDTFTVITVVVATIWGFTCAFTMWLLGTHAPSTPMTDSKITSGPGDSARGTEDANSNRLDIPTIGGDADGLSSGDDLDLSGLDMAPSDSESPAASGTDASDFEAAPATETPASETSTTETSANETSETEAPESEDSEAETPAP
ncbi:preprotein translocase subunit SecG [Rubripirellula amarantea]|uniref:Protein-export membrane protein SecG n=1 Tax=Rubripirellula amarantea TaxID=2527999 RepID=A0A5C5WSL6_9BACT|nr:preprotein translocase subunit SecG [Rubripirellula amarantea]TWT53617.1 preprotein translocase subunit SecG [Rubripirellula amarantea]